MGLTPAALGAATSGANSNITSLTGLTTPLSTALGGTGQTSLSSVNVATSNASITAQYLTTATGTAPSYSARAFATINPSTGGTYSPSLPAGNITSITKNSVGNFTLTFATAFIDSEYAVLFGGGGVPTMGVAQSAYPLAGVTAMSNTFVTFQFYSYAGSTNIPTAYDPTRIHVAIFR
jgi:hypothetical protein